jgi:hypothetical protein
MVSGFYGGIFVLFLLKYISEEALEVVGGNLNDGCFDFQS